jgi:phage-related protein
MPLDMRPELAMLIKGQIGFGLASSVCPAMSSVVPVMPTASHSSVGAVAAPLKAVVRITPMVQPPVDAVTTTVHSGLYPVTLAIQPPIDPVATTIQLCIDSLTPAIQPGVYAITFALQSVSKGFIALFPCPLCLSIISSFDPVTFLIQPVINAVTPAIHSGAYPVTLAIQPPINAITPTVQPFIKSIGSPVKTVFMPVLPPLAELLSLFRSHVLPLLTHFLSLLRSHVLPPLSELLSSFRVHLIQFICPSELRQCPP